MSKAIEDNLKNCIKIYSLAIENEIKHPGEDVYAEQESRAFTMLYHAIKDDVMEKFAQEILDNLLFVQVTSARKLRYLTYGSEF